MLLFKVFIKVLKNLTMLHKLLIFFFSVLGVLLEFFFSFSFFFNINDFVEISDKFNVQFFLNNNNKKIKKKIKKNNRTLIIYSMTYIKKSFSFKRYFPCSFYYYSYYFGNFMEIFYEIR